MTIFILVGALMVSVALGLLAWPLWKGRSSEGRGTLIALGVVVIALPLGATAARRARSVDRRRLSDWLARSGAE